MTTSRPGTAWTIAFSIVTAAGLAACGGTDDGEDRAAASESTSAESTSAASTTALVRGDAILIRTRIADARTHVAEVVSGSLIGESEFCSGGTASGGSNGATITTTFECPDGTLTVEYAPRQMSLVQSSEWEVVSGTGSFEGLRGGGSMVAAFDGADPDAGQEVFTGTVGD